MALLRKVVNNMVGRAATSDPDVDLHQDAVRQKLVHDPVCGLYVAEGLALPLTEGGEMVHFCSAACRDRYLSDTRKFAANA
jgi:YHS domain-containing protein